jgi:hypothetical protein
LIIALGDVYAQIPRRESVRALMRSTQESGEFLVRDSELRVHVVQESYVPVDSAPVDPRRAE